MAILDVWMEWYYLFLRLCFAVSLPSSLCWWGYMIWKMLVEEFQDGCLVYGHLWGVNGVILAISESSYCWKSSIWFLIKRIYGLKEDVGKGFQDGCIVHGHLWCVKGVILAISESPYCWKPSINFLFKRIHGLEEDVGWNIPRWLFSAWPSLMCESDVFC